MYTFGGSCPLTEFCQVQNSHQVRVWPSPILAALLHGTPAAGVSQSNFAAWYREWNYGTFAEGTTYIRLGGHDVVHWPTFLVVFSSTQVLYQCIARIQPVAPWFLQSFWPATPVMCLIASNILIPLILSIDPVQAWPRCKKNTVGLTKNSHLLRSDRHRDRLGKHLHSAGNRQQDAMLPF